MKLLIKLLFQAPTFFFFSPVPPQLHSGADHFPQAVLFVHPTHIHALKSAEIWYLQGKKGKK
jgi:hypothetical protein